MAMTDDGTWLSADEAEEFDLLRRSARDALRTSLTRLDAAQAGWTGLLIDEELGGQGWFPAAAGAIAVETGAASSSSGWMASALAAGLLVGGPAEEWRADVLAGAVSPAFGLSSSGVSSPGLSGTTWTGTGRVLSDGEPELLVLVAPDGSEAWAARPSDPGLRLDPVALDTTRTVTQVTAHGVEVVGLDPARVERVLAASALLNCADSIGALRSTLALVTTHLVERQAFGVSLASMQVLQHRLVDHDVLCSAGGALVASGLRELGATGAPSAATWAAPQYVHDRVVAALDDCIQLAGGIGFTWEFPVHHALRRATVGQTLGPGADLCRERLAAAAGW